MTMQIPTPATRQGSALIAAATLIVVIVAMASALTSLSISSFEQQIDRRDQLQRMVASESAANITYRHLQDNFRSLAEGELETIGALKTLDSITMINGTDLSGRLTHISGTNDNDYVFLVQGTAEEGEPTDAEHYRRHRVEFIVRTWPITVFSQAMFAIEGYDFDGSATTNSYDSSASTYSGATANSNGDLGSEGQINVKNSKISHGDVQGDINDNQEFPLPEFDYDTMQTTFPINTDEDGTMLDSAYITANSTVISYTDPITSVVTPYTVLHMTEADSPYRFEGIKLGSADRIYIDGRIRIFSDTLIVMESKNVMYKDAASRLTLYQDDFDPPQDSEINLNLDGSETLGSLTKNPDGSYTAPADQFIIYTEYAGHMTLNGNGAFCGVLYAPNATLKLNGTFDFFGAVIAKAFSTKIATTTDQGKVNGNFAFHYDENLANLAPDLTPRLVVTGWRSFPLGHHFED